MAIVLEKKFVIDEQDKSVGITLPLTKGNNGYFDVSYTTKEQIKTNIKSLILLSNLYILKKVYFKSSLPLSLTFSNSFFSCKKNTLFVI